MNLILLTSLLIASCSATTEESTLAPEEKPIIEVLTPPPAKCERKTKKGDLLYFHHIGKLTTGQEFDNTHKNHNNEPLAFKLGAGHVIDGWERGLLDMCVGEKRKLTIPPSLGYAEKGYGETIPANSTLISEIELVDIQDDDGTFEERIFGHHQEKDHIHASPIEFEAMDENQDGYMDKEELTKYITKKNEEAKEEDKIKDVSKVVDDMMKEHDQDSDGKLSFAENQHMFGHHDDEDRDPHEYDHSFQDMDADKDNFVTLAEMSSHFVKHNEAGKQGRTKEDIEKAVKEYFEEHDLDKDGKLSPEENLHQPDHGGEL